MSALESFQRGVQIGTSLETLKENRTIFKQEQKKKKEVDEAIATSMVPMGPNTMAAPSDTQDSSSGLTVNISQQKQLDPELLASKLDKIDLKMGQEYRLNLAAIRKADLEYSSVRQAAQLEDLHTATRLIAAGNQQEAMDVVNNHLPEGKKIVELKPLGGSIFQSKDQKGNVQKFDLNKLNSAVVGAKENFLNQFDAPVYNPSLGVIAQRNPNTGKVEVLARVKDPGAKGTEEQNKLSNTLWEQWMNMPRTKAYLEISASRSKIQEMKKQGTVAADLAILYGYITMVQPSGSKVTDQDFATAETARPILERAGLSWDQYKALWDGKALTEAAKQPIVDATEKIYLNAKELQKETVDKQFIARRDAMSLPKELFNPSFIHGDELDLAKDKEQLIEDGYRFPDQASLNRYRMAKNKTRPNK